MERLLVDRKDRNLRVAVLAGIVEGSDLDDHRAGKAWRPAHDLGSAIGAEFPGHGVVEIAALESLRLTGRVFETRFRYGHDDVGAAARTLLAFATVALPLKYRLTLRAVAHRLAIASAFESHFVLLIG